ncbi:hypothetical protein [Peribacillus asahii]|uniref:hypothetical protein n=1 Tax=Peribacillus asahii TaxID=228899 RepID=UPI002079ECF3|nr:hypothetical protein [Peribacillus asahii]USK70186.1 hypothetical protein LIS76_22325 [Peribacillus asahii]
MINTYGDLIELLNTHGESIKTVAKKLPFGEKKLRVLLKDAEYSYSRATSKWRYTGEGQAPDDELLLGKPREEETETLPSAQLTEEQVVSVAFTPEQEMAINKVVKEYLANAIINVTPPSQLNLLHERVMALPREEGKRSTLLTYGNVLDRIEKLAQRTWIDKAALVTIALSDFVDKYE